MIFDEIIYLFMCTSMIKYNISQGLFTEET